MLINTGLLKQSTMQSTQVGEAERHIREKRQVFYRPTGVTFWGLDNAEPMVVLWFVSKVGEMETVRLRAKCSRGGFALD